MDALVSFLTEHWYLVLAGLLLLFLVFKMLKALFKWLLILAVLAGLLFYGLQYRKAHGGGQDAGFTSEAAVVAALKDRALEALRHEMRDAKVERHKDGSFTLRTQSVQLDGKPGDKQAQVRFMNHTFHVDLDQDWKQLLDDVQKQR